MRNFWRVLGQARRYPLTLLGIVATSLLVALFWGANIGTVYPLVEVAFEGETASGWLERKIEQSQARIRMWERQAETHPADARIRYHLRAERLLAERYVSARPWVAAYAPRTAWGLLAAIMGLLLVGTLLKNVVLAANLLLVERLAQTVTCDLRQAFFRHVLAMDLRTLDGRHSSDMIARLTSDMNSITGALAALLGRAVREPLKMIACLAGALWISWRLTLVSLIAAPLAACLIGVLARALKRASRRALEQMNEMYGVLSEVLASMEIVKAYTLEEDKARRFDRSARQFRRRMLRIAFYQALLRPSTELLGIGMISLAILAGGYLVLHQQT
ncbi:MAG TPA: ABC transporter ATP-binding protein, partial [Thermopetrobacter sp.]|nr:ABC transporter ATP-binding protein [Thermopetrobacter sp.]